MNQQSSEFCGMEQEQFRRSGDHLKVKDELIYSSPKMLPYRGDIRVEFSGKNLTNFGGIELTCKFVRKFRVKEELNTRALM